jgi:hypothetical protein
MMKSQIVRRNVKMKSSVYALALPATHSLPCFHVTPKGHLLFSAFLAFVSGALQNLS